ncbi:hypothetical protein AB0G02_29170, partial [Actinosynnema sp. NPDC023658]|uniref:hypothetical protein n=1 Tax=Actinosynnema sp. NPDC023658 TaxID=3155465 RepID=UPI00340411B3
MSLHSSRSRRVACVLAAALVVGMAGPAAATADPLAPLLSSSEEQVADRYIVVLKHPDQGGPSAAADALAEPLALARDRGGQVR